MIETDEPIQLQQQTADPETVRILEEMLESNETITARAVARKHSSIKHASSITRHQGRADLLKTFQEKQAEFRRWMDRAPKASRTQLASQLAAKDARIKELEQQVEILRVSHLAMIRAVGELGGASKWLRFFEPYREIRDSLNNMGLTPATKITELKRSGSRKAGTKPHNHSL